jgi:hypothetical protein
MRSIHFSTSMGPLLGVAGAAGCAFAFMRAGCLFAIA